MRWTTLAWTAGIVAWLTTFAVVLYYMIWVTDDNPVLMAVSIVMGFLTIVGIACAMDEL